MKTMSHSVFVTRRWPERPRVSLVVDNRWIRISPDDAAWLRDALVEPREVRRSMVEGDLVIIDITRGAIDVIDAEQVWSAYAPLSPFDAKRCRTQIQRLLRDWPTA